MGPRRVQESISSLLRSDIFSLFSYLEWCPALLERAPDHVCVALVVQQVMDLGGDDLSLGPARNHPQERMRHGYKPY